MRKLVTVLLLAAIAWTTGLSSSQAQSPRSVADIPLSEIHQREIIVELDASKGVKSASAFCAQLGVKHVRQLPLSYTDYEIIQVPEGEDYHSILAGLQANPQVKSAGPNVIKHVSETILTDPLLLGSADNTADALLSPAVKNNQWALLQTGCLDAWDDTTGDPHVVVAVLDTGANLVHQDLVNRFWVNTDEEPGNSTDDDSNGFVDDINGYDFENWSGGVGGDPDPTDPSAGSSSHGTSTSSIIGAQGNNGTGIAGVAGGDTAASGVRLMICRVGTNTTIQVASEIGAIDYAINNGAKVISMSFGGYSGGTIEEDAINRAWNAGVYVVAAAGNVGQGNEDGEGNWLVDLPAGFDNCVAVGATTIFSSQNVTGTTQIVNETLAAYSKTGPEIEISAPGTHVMAAANGVDTYTDSVSLQFTGTSAATPVVAGLAALLLSKDYALNGSFTLGNEQVRQYINETAFDLGDAGRDEETGFGSIRMNLALDQLDGNIQGDTNDDGVIDENDVQPIIDRFGAKTGDANYDENADANRDGVIDELDLQVVGRNFGKTS